MILLEQVTSGTGERDPLDVGRDVVELTDADDLHVKGKTFMIKAEKSFRKADGYYKINENYSGNTKNKAFQLIFLFQ